MKTKTITATLASLAAASLVAAQPASAATAVRSGSATSSSEDLAALPSGAWIAIAAIVAVGIFAIVDSSSDDDPVSP